MKSALKIIHWSEDRSFLCRRRCEPKFEFHWHYHPAYQLELLIRGKARLFVADRILPFEPKQLLLLGPNLPHSMLTEATATKENSYPESVIVQFPEILLENGLFRRPELRPIQRLLDRSRSGLIFSADQCRPVFDRTSALPERSGFDQLHDLLWILHTLAESGAGEKLASETYRSVETPTECERINIVCAYVQDHLDGDLRESDVASMIHLSPSAFSRFFKRATGMTFVDYLNGLRIGRACRQLIETDDSVLHISLAAGFANKAHFNRQFKLRKGVTPSRFRKMFRTASLS